MRQPGGRRDGAVPGGTGRDPGGPWDAGGPRDDRGRRDAPRPRRPGRWGTWQGGLGVGIVVVGAAIGAAGTIVTKSAPGFLLEVLLVAGTVAAAFAVRPRAGRLILPVPVLAYLVAAVLSGVIFDRAAASSRTELALAAVQWIADGFFAMALATVLAAAIIAARWYLWHRRHLDRPPARNGPAQARPARPRPAQAGPTQAGPRPGSGPYNFSSGA